MYIIFQYCVELKLETSSITGEAEPTECQSEYVQPDVNVFEAHNVAFNGSMCTDGEGIALVIKTANNTVCNIFCKVIYYFKITQIIGQIATMTTNQQQSKSHLEIQINKFVKFLTCLAIIVAVISFVAGVFKQSGQIINVIVTAFTVCAVAMVSIHFIKLKK